MQDNKNKKTEREIKAIIRYENKDTKRTKKLN